MNKVLKNSVLVFSLGVLGCVNLACNTSVEAKNGNNLSKIEMQVLNSDLIMEADSQKTAHKPMVLSEEQFAKLVVDFTSTDKKFKGKKPCVIDFYADWCRPCRFFAPTFEKMAEKYGDKVNFYKVNTDDCKKLSAAYSITNIPTLFFFDKKGTLRRAVGAPSEEEFENAIKTIMQ